MKTIYQILILLVVLFALMGAVKYTSTNEEVHEATNVDSESEINSEIIEEQMSEENNAEVSIEILQEGEGLVAENGKVVAVHYTGKFEDGTVFDSSIQRGTPIEFTLGSGMVIKGWEQGILGMKVGERRVLTIPPELGYGMNDYGPIPGGSTLIFDVELVDVK